MDNSKQDVINKIKELKRQNDEFVFDVSDLADTESSRTDIISTIYIRKNRELRLNNLWEIENDFRTQARIFNQSPEKYTVSQESIKKSYIEQINRFMREYNTRYMSIQNELYRAEENQKILMFKSCKYSNSKKMYMLSENYQRFISERQKLINQFEKTNDFELYKKIENIKDPVNQYDEKIVEYKNKIKLYENIISMCDQELDKCIKSREEDFHVLFGEEQSLLIKPSGYKLILNIIMNKIDGDKRFSKLVVKKHATRINEIKIKKMAEYADKIKQDTINFSNEIENMLKKYGE